MKHVDKFFLLENYCSGIHIQCLLGNFFCISCKLRFKGHISIYLKDLKFVISIQYETWREIFQHRELLLLSFQEMKQKPGALLVINCNIWKNICAKFHENWWKTEEVVRDERFSPNFCHNMPLPWQHTFYHCQKMCLAHLHPKANICAKFHENWWKTEEVVRDARFSPHFCHNMPLPWQHTFYHCQKMCLAHLHPKANICAKFHENWWKTEEVVRDARFPPPFLP